ncbi:MAG: glycosyltransferase family 2 protein, partial [Nitrospinaceae bacterium]
MADFIMKEEKNTSGPNASSGIPELSIVLVNYKSADHTRECIRSIRNNVKDAGCEIIVVDNASGDGGVETIRKEFPETALIENQSNLGFAKAVNQGIRSSSGKYVWLLNNDTVVLPGALEAMLQTMDRFPETGILGCRLLNPDKTPQESFGRMSGFPGDLAQKLFMNRLMECYSNPLAAKVVDRMYAREKEVGWVCGACMLCRREALEDAGLMDENFFMYKEDVDLCIGVRRRGWGVRY